MIRVLLAILFLFFTSKTYAQLSPGDLSKPHSQLEGISNCTKCHEIGEKVTSKKCLDCHTILKELINSGKGLHSGKDFTQCETCHSDHHGREFKMIYWEKGQDNFDHNKTGFGLKGKHSSLKCNDCHISSNIENKQKLQSKKKDLNRTFLGLAQECLSCHIDEHRGQMDSNCLNCHNIQSWKPAPKFDHNLTKYRLTGLHKKKECKNCHKTKTDNKFEKNNSYLKFAGLKFNNCSNCHKDPHNDKFDNKCENCHNTGGWQNYDKNKFDHNKTRYSLKGKHVFVSCEKCHGSKKSKKISQFKYCSNCHRDYHAGQFKTRPQKGACEECHTVYSFSPSDFTIEDHNETGYPLSGSHLAIPCISCHKKTRKHQNQFQFRSTECITCHSDPHKGEVDKFRNLTNASTGKTGCQYCHVVESWQQTVNFNHSNTKFALEGEHLLTRCGSCHKQINIKGKTENLMFAGLETKCHNCHTDVHLGQFANAIDISSKEATTNCDHCHTPSDWLAEKFDHNKHARYKLEGAHVYVNCSKCHMEEINNGIKFVKYKPLSTECRDCHTDNIFLGKKNKL